MHSKKIRTDAETLWKRKIELSGVVRERVARATVESAWLKAVLEEAASVNSMLAASRVEGDNSC